MIDKRKNLVPLYLEIDYLEETIPQHRLPATGELAGKRFDLYLEEDSTTFSINFQSASQLEWWKGNESAKQERYEAIAIRPDIFFVDWLDSEDQRQSTSVVLDLVAQEATLVWSVLPNLKEAMVNIYERIKKNNDLSAVKARIAHAGINGERAKKVHQRTEELVGKRIKYTYSSQEIYEHIYLNESMFAWHCLLGRDKGAAEADPVDYIKIGEKLYLFIWRETIASWIGIIVINLSNNRSAGKLYWDNPHADKINNVVAGAYAELLNETS